MFVQLLVHRRKATVRLNVVYTDNGDMRLVKPAVAYVASRPYMSAELHRLLSPRSARAEVLNGDATASPGSITHATADRIHRFRRSRAVFAGGEQEHSPHRTTSSSPFQSRLCPDSGLAPTVHWEAVLPGIHPHWSRQLSHDRGPSSAPLQPATGSPSARSPFTPDASRYTRRNGRTSSVSPVPNVLLLSEYLRSALVDHPDVAPACAEERLYRSMEDAIMFTVDRISNFRKQLQVNAHRPLGYGLEWHGNVGPAAAHGARHGFDVMSFEFVVDTNLKVRRHHMWRWGAAD